MKRKTIVLWTVLTLVVGGGITWKVLKGPDPVLVVTAKAERVRNLRAIVSATGEIRAKEFVDIQAEVPGVIIELPVREGDQVKKGDILLRLDDLQLRADEDAARAQVGAAEADAQNNEVGVATALANLAAEETALANLKVDLEQARVTRARSQASYLRKKELFDGGLLGIEEYELADADARIAQQRLAWNEARIRQGDANLNAVATRVDAARAQRDGTCRRIDAAKAALARATDLLGKTVLRSPLNGLITKLNVEKGERAVPGIQSNPIATLMTIADMSVIEAEIKVNETDIVHVEVGAPAEVEVDALGDQKLDGKVTEIGQSPIQPAATGSGTGSSNQNQEGKDFKVKVRLANPPPSLRPGFTAQARIVTAVREECMVLPLPALTKREVEIDAQGRYVPAPEPVDDKTPQVYAGRRQNRKEFEGVFLLLDGRARFRPVQTGVTGEMDIEVLSGLVEGDEVVSGPNQALKTMKEWDRIKIDVKKQADYLLRQPRKKK
ncbi:MAG TPA: efflux RND transporter periplasmic adaptor subunit [Planctomycetota bacterium]|nr:efflux RND transporter periplasmic adaptor subunit [Planctomycetota bacterium]